MEVVRLGVAVVLVLSSVTQCKAAAATPSGGGGGGGGGDAHSMPCIQKLMPCQPYIRTASPPPPPSCCMPLKEIVENDLTCLCSVFNNVDMLKSLNLTKQNALVLPNACGAKADVSKCKTTTTPGTTPTSPANEQSGSGSSGDSAAATSTAKSTSSAPATNFVGLTFGFASPLILAKLFF